MKRIVLFFSIILMLNSCYYTAATLAIEGARATADSEKGRYKDVEMTLAKGYQKEDLQNICNFAFVLNTNAFAINQSMLNLFSDNLTKEFIEEGYNVVDRELLSSIVRERNIQESKYSDEKQIINTGGIEGATALFKGSIKTGFDVNYGFMGIGTGVESGITEASLKLIDVQTGKIILIASAVYKKPKASSVVANDIALAFKVYQNGGDGAEQKVEGKQDNQKSSNFEIIFKKDEKSH